MQSPNHIPGIEIGPELGHGAHSVVYRARYKGAVCAVKIPRVRGQWTRWVYREAVALARVRDPGLPRVLEVGESDGLPYLIMELVDGETLAERLSRGTLPPPEVVAIGSRLFSTLRSVHDAGLIHRDVKPRNLVLESDGSVRLLDFGFATPSERGPVHGPGAGTPGYAAPEQMRAPSRIDGRADLYAAGRVLFECIAGHLPARLPDPEGQRAIRAELVDCGAEPLAELVAGLLHEAPERRYPDARAVLADLDRLSRDLPAEGPSAYEPADRAAPIVGRQVELARIARVASAASQSGGSVILVQGTRGSGKTRLLAAAAAAWHAEHRRRAVQIHCREGDPPLAAPRRILESFVERLDRPSFGASDGARALRDAAEGPLASVASLIAPRLKHLLDDCAFEPAAEPSAFPEGAAELLVRLTRRAGPLLILIDDLQWVDPASRDVLARLAHWARQIPLCLVLASRSSDASTPGLDRFRNIEDSTVVIDLPNLNDQHAAALVAAHLGVSSVDPSWVKRIAALSDGTPLGILEVLGAFLDVGALRPLDGSWHLDPHRAERVALPAGALVMLGRRVVELPAATLRVLDVAAVAGTAFSDELVAEAVGLSTADLEYALADARRAGLVQAAEPGWHRFVHDSLRELLVSGIGDAERRGIHQRLATALDRKGSQELENLCAVALHYAAGTIQESPVRAYESARAAAHAALGTFDNETAIRFLDLARTAAEVSGIKLDASYFQNLGEAQLRIGALDESLRSLEAALAHVGDRKARATLLGRMAWVHQSNPQPEHAWRALDQAFTELGVRMPVEGLGSAAATIGKLGSRSLRTVSGRAKSPKRSHDAEVAALLCDLHYQNARLGLEYNKPLRLLQSAIQAFAESRTLDRSRALARSTGLYGFIQIAMGRREAGTRYLDAAHKLADELGEPVTKAFCVQLGSVSACFAGDFDRALIDIKECLDDRGHWLEINEYCHDAATADLIEAMRGRPDHGWAWIQRAVNRVRRSDQSSPAFIDLVVHRARACLASRARDFEIEAWLAEQIAIAVGRDRPREGFCWLLSWGSRVRVLTERGDFGPEFEALVRSFEAEGHKPKTAHPALAEYYIAVAHARAHQCLRAPKSARTSSLRALRRAFADLAAAAKLPLYKAHRVVLEAYVAWLSGDIPRAERLLADAEQRGIREVAPWVSYAVARARAHMLRDAGNTESARDHALHAESLARAYGAEVRARWIREEFDLAVAAPAPGPHTQSSGLRSSSHARRQLAALLHVVRAGTRDLAPERQAVAILDELIRDVDADRGYLWFQPDLGMSAHLMVSRTREGETTFGADPTHESMLRSVRESGAIDPPATDLDALEEAPDGHRMIAAPLALQGRAVGAFCVERSGSAPAFGREDWDLLSVLAEQVPIALEVGRLLAERDQLHATLQQAQKMEAVGQLAGGVAHDFNNMLLAIQTAVDSLGRRGQPGDVRAEIDVISEATGRAAELTSKLLGFSRHNPVPLAPCDLNQTIAGIEPMLRRLVGEHVSVRLELDRDLYTVKAERASMEQAIVNLAVNARDAMPDGGCITIKTSNVALDASALRRGAQSTGDHALVTVTDTGQGMEEEVMSRVFEPFFTTKGAGRGTGLGLATFYAFVKNCGGHVEVESQVGEGTTFRVYLPRSERIQVVEQRRPVLSTAPPRASSETILVVDDEELVAKSIRRMLESGGYEVLVAHDAGRAFELAEARGPDISLVILDMIMPDVSGSELGRRLHELELPAKLLYVSGYSPDAAELPPQRTGDDGFLEKPFSMNDLLGQVRRLLDSG